MQEPPQGSDWRLCRSGRSKWKGLYSSRVLDNWELLEQAELNLGLSQGQPFLLRPDGGSDPEVSAYFASPGFRRLAGDSQISYARDLKVFLSFLERHGTGWREATHDTVLDYEYWRRRDPNNRRKVGGAKFARELAACAHFYRWQASRSAIAASPILTMTVKDRRGDETTRAQLQPSNVRSVKVKWLTPLAYRRWRDVGLGGYTAEGLLQDSWRGRNDGRNTAMSDLMWSSGLRLREAGTLLVAELPVSMGAEQFLRGRIGEASAKGAAREYWVSRSALQRIGAYVSTTRAESVRRARIAGRYDEIDQLMIVTQITKRGVVTYEDESGRSCKTHLDHLGWEDRQRLFQNSDTGIEPAALWLTEGGTAMPYLTWEAVFSTASKRCSTLDVPISCHPHMLRHSFALRMLVTLVYAHDRRLGLSEAERLEYRHLFGDPWVLVQTMLGHTKLSTTRSYYLEPLQGMQIDMLLNGDNDEDSIQDLLTRVAATSPRIQDVVGES